MTQSAWFDVSAGVAGDMMLGALVDAGANLEAVQAAVDSVIPGAVTLKRSEVTRFGMRATKVDVVLLEDDHTHRSFVTIQRLIESATLSDEVALLAQKVFRHLAEAEGRVHALPASDVIFHEVGALDSIADIVGTCAALQDLGIGQIFGGEIALGSGHISSAHGTLPVPVPAVLEMSRGWRVLGAGRGEMATPTGVAVLTSVAEYREDLPPMSVVTVGVGAGTRDVHGRANVVRVVVGTPVVDRASDLVETGEIVLECNIDDLDPRVWPGVLSELLSGGASDAWLTPILMKKGRPAHTLCALVPAEHVEAIRTLIFHLTSTIGLRETFIRKIALPRTWIHVPLGSSTVRIKVAHRGGVIVQATPEFDEVVLVAESESLPVRAALEQAISAGIEAGLIPGARLPHGLEY